MSQGCDIGVRQQNSVTAPAVFIIAIVSAKRSVNQRLPSAPRVMPYGPLPALGSANSLKWPLGVIRPITPRLDSVNQSAWSGPRTIEYGRLFGTGSANSVTDAR